MRTSAALLPVLGFVLSSCDRREESSEDPPSSCEAPESPTWDNFARGYVTTWCTGCHSKSLTGDARQGAPEVLNFDLWSEVHAARVRVAARATGESPDMPPLGGTNPEDVLLLARWIECGAPGQDDPPDPCDTSRVPERRSDISAISSQEEADMFCASSNSADSLQVSGDVALDCLCSVHGDLAIDGAELQLPSVRTISGDVSLAGTSSLLAPKLTDVGGSLSASGQLSDLDLSELRSVGGDLRLSDLSQGSVSELRLDSLLSIGGALSLTHVDGVNYIDVPRLETVGGDMILEDMPSLVMLDGTRVLDSVGGSLRLQDLPSLVDLDDFSFMLLSSVGSEIRIERNSSLLSVSGFALLPFVPGDVVVSDCPSLDGIPGFDSVVTVMGELRVERNGVMRGITGFVNLERVIGTLVLRELPGAAIFSGFEALTRTGRLRIDSIGSTQWLWMPQLQRVDGSLLVQRNSSLSSIGGFGALSLVGGNLSLFDNPALVSIDGLLGVDEVGGMLEVSGTPGLDPEMISDWISLIGPEDIDGPVRIR